jgi:hypothetical protein
MRSSWRAMRSFSSFVIEAPGLCSPSRMVVSNMISFSLLMGFSWRARMQLRRAYIVINPGIVHPAAQQNRIEVEYLARDAQQQARQQGAGKKEQHRGLVRGTHGRKI